MRSNWKKIVTEIEHADGSIVICVTLPNPVEGNRPIIFETGPLPAGRRDWARRQAEREAFRLLDKARGLYLDPCHITYLSNMAERAA